MTNFAKRVLAAFTPVGVPPELPAVDEALVEHFDAGPLIRGLRNRPWTDFVNGNDIFAIEEDALVWTSYLPREWFLYYLPAMLIAVQESSRDCAHNLRGLLNLIFECTSPGGPGRSGLREYVLGRLTESQSTLLREGTSPDPGRTTPTS